MTATTIAYTITSIRPVELDNGGADCEYCSENGAVIDTQIYYTDCDGNRQMEEGCGGCMLGRMGEIADLGAADEFQVEVQK